MAQDPNLTKFKRHLTNARREMRRAVERASEVDLRRGHYAEARRRAQSVRDAADELLRSLDPSDAD